MYLVVVGAGNIGTPLIEIATASGNEVVVVERDDQKATETGREFDCLVINDDATVKETLVDAGVGRADALVSTTDRDAVNVMVCLLAQEFAVPSVVSVVHDPAHMELFERIGIQTMENPQRLIAEYLYRAVERPAIVDYMPVGEEAEVFEIAVARDADVLGCTLAEANETGLLPNDVLVVAVERDDGEPPITPRGETTLREGDLVTVYSGHGADASVTDVFGHHGDR